MLSGKAVGLLLVLLFVSAAAAVPFNEQPMFGSQPKTPDMVAAPFTVHVVLSSDRLTFA